MYIRIIISQGSSLKVELEGSVSDLNKVETEVRFNTLVIKLQRGTQRIKNVVAYVTLPKIEELDVSGSGHIKAKTDIKADDLVMDVSGSGKIKIDQLNANNLEIDISGSEKGQKLKFSISGSGDVEACGVEASDVEGDISGSGTACVWVTKKLNADISGSGKISYKGNPAKLYTDTSGSGKVRKLN